jgi:hypothetical protein
MAKRPTCELHIITVNDSRGVTYFTGKHFVLALAAPLHGERRP